MTAIAIPNVMRSLVSFLDSATRYRAVQIALAVEKFRARHGQLPETLDDLQPDFIESLPQTIFGGEPFQYTIKGLGYTIESQAYIPQLRPIAFTVTRVEEP